MGRERLHSFAVLPVDQIFSTRGRGLGSLDLSFVGYQTRFFVPRVLRMRAHHRQGIDYALDWGIENDVINSGSIHEMIIKIYLVWNGFPRFHVQLY